MPARQSLAEQDEVARYARLLLEHAGVGDRLPERIVQRLLPCARALLRDGERVHREHEPGHGDRRGGDRVGRGREPREAERRWERREPADRGDALRERCAGEDREDGAEVVADEGDGAGRDAGDRAIRLVPHLERRADPAHRLGDPRSRWVHRRPGQPVVVDHRGAQLLEDVVRDD